MTTSPLGSLQEELNIVSGMLREGTIEAAVGRAEILNERDDCPESAALLAGAITARIDQAIPIAKASVIRSMVKGAIHRLPGHRPEFERRLDYLSAWHGDASGLLRPWATTDLSTAERSRLGGEVRRWIRDPRHLASCTVLDEQHELRRSATGIWEAFSTVTSGPVSDEQIALPEVSRRSPLAPWKFLIRALASFYRMDDGDTRRNMERIPDDSAPGRLKPVLDAMIRSSSTRHLPANSRKLIKQVHPDSARLRRALQTVDRLLGATDPNKQRQAIRAAVKECEHSNHDLLVPLRQHLSIRCWLEDVPAVEVRRAMGAPSYKDTSFWRLLARASEVRADEMFDVVHLFHACAAWEEFRRHAIAAGWIAAEGPEEAAIYLRMAMLLKKPPRGTDPSAFESRFDGQRDHYRDQPTEIRQLAPTSPPDTYFLYPHEVYARAAYCHPSTEVFQEWLDWTHETFEHWRPADEVALAWHRAMPDRPQPLLLLVDSAERRNALKKALGHLDRAEALDPLDGQVVRARLRLLVSTTRRHLKAGKLHLAEKDLAQLTALPGMDGAHQRAFLEALRFSSALLGGDHEAASEHRDRTVRLAGGELAAHAVLGGVASACGQGVATIRDVLPPLPALLRQGALPAAAAWACDAGERMAYPLVIPSGWLRRLREDLAAGPCGLEPAALERLANAALRQREDRLAYAAAGAGLRLGGPRDARFLLLRGQTLPGFASPRRVRAMRACLTLARRAGDTLLAGVVLDVHRRWTGRDRGAMVWGIDTEIEPLVDQQLARVLRREREAQDYPTPASYDPQEDLDPEEDLCNCPACRRRRGETELDDDDPYTDDPDDLELLDFLESIPKDLLPGVLEELNESSFDETGQRLPGEAMALILEMMQKFGGPDGALPDPEEVARRDPDLFRRLTEISADMEDEEFLPPGSRGRAAGSRAPKQKKRKKKRGRG